MTPREQFLYTNVYYDKEHTEDYALIFDDGSKQHFFNRKQYRRKNDVYLSDYKVNVNKKEESEVFKWLPNLAEGVEPLDPYDWKWTKLSNSKRLLRIFRARAFPEVLTHG